MAGSSSRRSKRLRNSSSGGVPVGFSRWVLWCLTGVVRRLVLFFGVAAAVVCVNVGGCVIGFQAVVLYDLLSVFFEDVGFPALDIKVKQLKPRRLHISWRFFLGIVIFEGVMHGV
nr:hypothetical protein Iba_chr13cCG9170 [Ipomoea batatas]